MPPKRIVKRKAKKASDWTIRHDPMSGKGVKVNNRTGQMWQIDPLTGKGFWGDLWSGVKKVFNFAKDNKVISTVAGMIPHPVAQRIDAAAGSVGMGRYKVVPYASTLVR
jgi:hypothetical protein